jgi:ankyrin repeat protein
MYYSDVNEVLSSVSNVVEFLGVEITDIDTPGIFGNTPLAVVMSWPETEGGLRAAHLLLDAGANVNMQVEDGDTALHRAVLRGKIDTIKLLLNKNSRIDIKNNAGQTALDLAHLIRRDDIVEILKGAKH